MPADEVYGYCPGEPSSTVGRGSRRSRQNGGNQIPLSFTESQLDSSIRDLQSSGDFAQIAIAVFYVSMKLLGRKAAEQSEIRILAHMFIDGVARNTKRASRSGRLKVVAGKRFGNSVVVDRIGGRRGYLRRWIASAKHRRQRGRDLGCRVASTMDRQLGCEIAQLANVSRPRTSGQPDEESGIEPSTFGVHRCFESAQLARLGKHIPKEMEKQHSQVLWALA